MNSASPSSRIYRLKLIIVGLLLVFGSLALSALSESLDSGSASRTLVAVLRGLADVLLVTGAIGIAIDFFTGRDKEAADTERTRNILKELTPEFADAVIKGFRVNKEDLRRVASPELLDEIATNVLSLRLGDDQFAQELYTAIRDQAIHTPERWHDVNFSVRLSTAVERNTGGIPLFEALVESEYTVTPSHATVRFACVSDRDEFHELLADVPATSSWLMPPRPGFDASSRESFELLAFSVDGEDRKIRRSDRKSGQMYSVTIGDDIVRGGQPVRIRHAFRTIIDPASHRLFLTVAQPARNISLAVDYSSTGISRMGVLDRVSGSQRPYVSQLPTGTTGKELTIEVPGWVQAGTAFTFVWTLDSEENPGHQGTRPTSANRAA